MEHAWLYSDLPQASADIEYFVRFGRNEGGSGHLWEWAECKLHVLPPAMHRPLLSTGNVADKEALNLKPAFLSLHLHPLVTVAVGNCFFRAHCLFVFGKEGNHHQFLCSLLFSSASSDPLHSSSGLHHSPESSSLDSVSSWPVPAASPVTTSRHHLLSSPCKLRNVDLYVNMATRRQLKQDLTNETERMKAVLTENDRRIGRFALNVSNLVFYTQF